MHYYVMSYYGFFAVFFSFLQINKAFTLIIIICLKPFRGSPTKYIELIVNNIMLVE